MTAFALKLIACISMLLDHIGYYSASEFSTILRTFGRLAMPIYAFFIAEGYRRTHNKAAYAGRLLLFAVLSEVPFDTYFFGTSVYRYYQNVFFTLFLALIAIWLYDECSKRVQNMFIPFLPVIFCCCIGDLLHTDYGWESVVTCFIFYMFPFTDGKNRLRAGLSLLAVFFVSLISSGGGLFRISQIFRLAALPLLFSYNGRQSVISSVPVKKAVKYAFYAFYPAHLIILYLLH